MTPIPRTVRLRACALPACSSRYDDLHWENPWPKSYCSAECHRDAIRSGTPAPERKRPLLKRATTPTKRKRAISPASPAQRQAISERACAVCRGHAGSCHPAHLIDRSLLGDEQDDPRATIALCPEHHRLYDEGGLDLLPWLEPGFRSELAFAVERFGLLRTLERVTNCTWAPVGEDVAA